MDVNDIKVFQRSHIKRLALTATPYALDPRSSPIERMNPGIDSSLTKSRNKSLARSRRTAGRTRNTRNDVKNLHLLFPYDVPDFTTIVRDCINLLKFDRNFISNRLLEVKRD